MKDLELTGDLEFTEFDGKIGFFYKEPCEDGDYHEVHGTVQKKIAEKGEKTILKYVRRRIKKEKMEWRKWEALEDYIRKNHVPIQAEYEDGTSLEGRIVEATDRYIGVELDKPLKGKSGINFGFASAMAGHYIFGENYTLSEHGLGGARTALCWAYRDALHKPEKDLVERLNSSWSAQQLKFSNRKPGFKKANN